MSARWTTLLVWALVGASALFWGLKLFVRAPAAPAGTVVASPGPVARADLTRLLGSNPVPVVAEALEPPPDARFQLIGVVTPRPAAAAREGLALIAVDGKPAKAYRVGAVVDGQTVLKSVAARGAQLGPRDGAAQVTLNLAPPAAAAVGTLPGMSPAVTPSPDALRQGVAPAQAPVGGFTPRNGPAVQAPRRMLPPPAQPQAEQGGPTLSPDNLQTR